MQPMVFYCTIEPLRNDDLYARAWALLPTHEQNRIATLRRVDDRLRSVAGQLLLRAALDELAVPHEQRTVLRSRIGRPYFTELPLQFSISHSGEVALCAISDGSIGVDVQTLHLPSEALLRRVCTAEEKAFLQSSNQLASDFSALWTRKESLIKATGRTIASDLRELDGHGWRFEEKLIFSLPACVCVPEDADTIKWQQVCLNSKFF